MERTYACLHQGPGDVGPAHLARPGDLLHLLQGDLDPQSIQFGDDLGIALGPGLF